jgi:hypothetical protein
MDATTIRLPLSLRAWPEATFPATLKAEIEALPAGSLPLDQVTINGWHVDDSHITATVLRVKDDTMAITADLGIFFTEIIAGCSCGDEPQSQQTYGELTVRIEKSTAAAIFFSLESV